MVRERVHVLCAVDVGEPGLAAFAQALALARAQDAKLLIVAPAPPDERFSAGAAERVDYLRRLRERAEAAGTGTQVSVQQGPAAEIILLHARARGADLIVVSAHHDAARGVAAGMIADDVLRAASCPTLVVGPSRRALRAVETFTRVLCAVDLSPASQAVVDAGLSFGVGADRTVTVVHVVKERTGDRVSSTKAGGNGGVAQQEALRRLQALAPAHVRGALLARVVTGRVARGIFRLARAMDADLIVIAARRRGRIGRRWRGVAAEIVRGADRPVLAVPPGMVSVELGHQRRRAA